MNYIISDVRAYEDAKIKAFHGADYNIVFNKATGEMHRWGKTFDDDPVFSEHGPEIADIEIVTDSCNGVGKGPCSFCYKSNTSGKAQCMTLADFKRILNVMPRINNVLFLQQIAFGITGVQSNPDFVAIMRYTRDNGVVPNFTLSGFDLTDKLLHGTAELVGAVAVSCYPADKELCYNTIAKYIKAGVKQTNMHLMYSAQNLDFVKQVLTDITYDERLRDLNAVVLLGLKPKGRGKHLLPANQQQFDELLDYATYVNVPFGLDSCSATKYTRFLNNNNVPNKTQIVQYVEPCESTLFSVYVNVFGEAFPCSFCEQESEWRKGINLYQVNDFLKEVWFSERISTWRNANIANSRQCIMFPQIN